MTVIVTGLLLESTVMATVALGVSKQRQKTSLLPDITEYVYGPIMWYHIRMFECEESAYKHWFTQAQIDYVITHAAAIFEVESRKPGDRTMAFLGYVDESRERRVEVLVSQRTRKAFHAMDCRPEWLRFFDQEK